MKALLYTVLGVSLSCTIVGCDSAQNPPAGRTFTPADDVTNTAPLEEHSHGSNGGHLMKLGDYTAEVAVEEDRKISIYLLGADGTSAAPVEGTVLLETKVGEPKSLAATAAPLEGEADGKSSRFEIPGDQVPESIYDIEKLVGTLTLTMGDKHVSAEIGHKEEAHEHEHEHEHEHTTAPAPAPASAEAEHEHETAPAPATGEADHDHEAGHDHEEKPAK